MTSNRHSGPARWHCGASHALACDVVGGSFHVKAVARPAPTIQGVAALFDPTDGRLLALVDSPELTARRTGAATALAARYLARAGPVRCLLCGAGRQAFAQIAAPAVVRTLTRVMIHDLDAARARGLADHEISRSGSALAPIRYGEYEMVVQQLKATVELHRMVFGCDRWRATRAPARLIGVVRLATRRGDRQLAKSAINR